MPVEVEVVTWIAAAPEVVFALELDVDVHAASLARSRETATTSTGRCVLALGDEVTFTARHLGRTWSMTAAVTELDAPRRFVDEQVRGPFRSLRHEHLFQAAHGGTTMTDRMVLQAPGGPAGQVVARAFLGPYLRHLLITRAAHIRAVADGASPPR